jgi:hypothetical protein
VPGLTSAVRLIEKYRALEALAAEPEATEPGPYADRRKHFKRELADRFPGALRELDLFTLDELRARREEIEEYLEQGDTTAAPRWILWEIDFHELTQALLSLKRRLPALPADQARELVRSLPALRELTPSVRDDLIGAVKAPPGGRLLTVVYDLLSARHGVPPEEIRDTLFPRRR